MVSGITPEWRTVWVGIRTGLMVRGIERFKAHFAPFADRYVLIGGTACSLVMEDVGLEFRAVSDW